MSGKKNWKLGATKLQELTNSLKATSREPPSRNVDRFQSRLPPLGIFPVLVRPTVRAYLGRAMT
jgi:hypothetical protein